MYRQNSNNGIETAEISLFYFHTVNLENLNITEVYIYIDIVIVESLDPNAFTDDPEDRTDPPPLSKSTDAKLDHNFLEIYYEFVN